jgi:hypothetical protein
MPSKLLIRGLRYRPELHGQLHGQLDSSQTANGMRNEWG